MMKKRRLAGAVILLGLLALLALGCLLYGDDLRAQFAARRRPTEPLTVTILDVGQGSAALVQTGGADLLIDCGERTAGAAVCDALRERGVTRLTAVYVTHLHTDHYGGLIEVLDRFPVEELILPRTPDDLLPTAPSYETLLDRIEAHRVPVTLCGAPGMRVLSESAILTVLDGFLPAPDGLNNTSLVLRIDCGRTSFLITGDAEKEEEARLADIGSLLRASVLVAGHHGSDTSSRQAFLNAVRPVASTISVGRDNGYHLPSPRVIERLAAFGPIYRTDQSGAISFSTDGRTIRVTADGIDDVLTPREE